MEIGVGKSDIVYDRVTRVENNENQVRQRRASVIINRYNTIHNIFKTGAGERGVYLDELWSFREIDFFFLSIIREILRGIKICYYDARRNR